MFRYGHIQNFIKFGMVTACFSDCWHGKAPWLNLTCTYLIVRKLFEKVLPAGIVLKPFFLFFFSFLETCLALVTNS